MSDLENAKSRLKRDGCTCVLCKGDTVHTSHQKGISPMVDLLDSGTDLRGFAAADKIVGKAAAMLFVLAGISVLHAEVLSRTAAAVLEKYNIPYTYGILTDAIINRKGSGLCPMEEAVADIEDPAAAFLAVKHKREQLRKGEHI